MKLDPENQARFLRFERLVFGLGVAAIAMFSWACGTYAMVLADNEAGFVLAIPIFTMLINVGRDSFRVILRQKQKRLFVEQKLKELTRDL